ncbi:hypothetical protein COJ45_27865 [Bacillus cereus]|nr:hypothetical protein COJ45_27865 [Bacillus cereus]
MYHAPFICLFMIDSIPRKYKNGTSEVFELKKFLILFVALNLFWLKFKDYKLNFLLVTLKFNKEEKDDLYAKEASTN